MIPVLIYPDVREAVDWLATAFGFVERVRIGESHRSQLSFGDGAVIVGESRDERRPPRPGEVTHRSWCGSRMPGPTASGPEPTAPGS